MKKIFLGLALFFLVTGLLHKQILGAGAKLALKWQCDCELAYRSVDWENGELVFTDLVVFDPTFHSHIEKASLRLDWKSIPKKLKGHLTIDTPHVSVIKKRELPQLGKDSWLDLTVSVHDGTADWDGLVTFSLDHTEISSLLTLDWEHSGLIVSLQEGKIEGELKNFKAPLLNSWVPLGQILSGELTGRLAISQDQELISANLKVSDFSVAAPLGSIEKMEGTISYNANLGAKWELQGVGNAREKQFPFSWSGRGFFKSHWIETEVQFPNARCKLSGEKAWNLECQQLGAEQLAWIQAGAALIWPELSLWNIASGTISGKSAFSFASWSAQFTGEKIDVKKGKFSLVCDHLTANVSEEGGQLAVQAPEYEVKVAGKWHDWKAETRLASMHLSLHGGWDGEKFPIQIEKGEYDDFRFAGSGWVDPNFDFCFNLDGKYRLGGKEIPFHFPNFSKKGSDWTFDFRLVRQTLDFLRLAGTYNGQMHFSEKSHLLGVPVTFAPTSLGDLDFAVQLPWNSLLLANSLCKEWGIDLLKFPVVNQTDLRLQYKNKNISVLASSAYPQFRLVAEQSENAWEVDLQSDLSLQATWHQDGTAKGRVKWKESIDTEFEGKIHPNLRCDFALSKVRFDIAELRDQRIQGILSGDGHFLYDGQIESDFDLNVSSLKIQNHPMDNQGTLHLSYSSDKGALISGINLHGPFDCIVELLEYDACLSHWIFHHAQVHLPGSFLANRFLDPHYDLNFTADLDFASDFSTFVCTMREGLIPFGGKTHHIENLHLYWNNGECKATLNYLNHFHALRLSIDDKITGRLTLGEEETPLVIDWEYTDAIQVQSIEGCFGGIEASFHADSPNNLIGSARVNFTVLSQLLPPDIAQVFDEIKMGKGYELKGRLQFEKNQPHFQGLLSGKQLELFGFQFRTLLAQVDLGPSKIRIYDVKISDTAGMMKIDEILLQGIDDLPWTIAIPTLTIIDLRPSLLLRPGSTVGPIEPLVVRELKMTDFKGLLDDGKTYTAKGKAHFINSFKREETVFDLPVNVLSRIVGLDLELLIPVTGDLDFELKDGYFNLTALTNAYSEGKRSEFFLEMEPQPYMDLDGNLNIFIKMKQHVLLKFTESFLISIDGQLDDPQFHLKRRRFFGLLTG